MFGASSGSRRVATRFLWTESLMVSPGVDALGVGGNGRVSWGAGRAAAMSNRAVCSISDEGKLWSPLRAGPLGLERLPQGALTRCQRALQIIAKLRPLANRVLTPSLSSGVPPVPRTSI